LNGDALSEPRLWVILPEMRRLGLLLLSLLAANPAAGAECERPLPTTFEPLSPILARAEAWLAKGDLACAEALAEAALEHHPDAAEAWALLGRVRVLDRRHLSAEEPLRRAVELGQSDPRTLLYLGATLWENAQPTEAEEVLRRAVAASGRHRLALQQLGRLLSWSGRYEEAAEILREAALRGRPDPGLALDLATALEGAGRLDDALAAYRRAIELDPENGRARYGRAQVLAELGREKEAEAEMARYRELYREGQERTRREGLAALRPAPDFEELTPPETPLPEGPGSGEIDCGQIAFEAVARSAGLDFRHETGARGGKHLPETMGAGLAFLDADGDGWQDLYLVQSGPSPGGGEGARNRLFRGWGGRGEIRFEEVEASGAEDPGYGQGATAADVDGDGRTDLYVTNDGRDALYLNRTEPGGTIRFVDATAEAGLGLEGWSSSAAFADAEGDGDLDLYVSRYLEYTPDHGLECRDTETGRRKYCDPSLFLGAGDRFFLQGEPREGLPRFADATEAAGLGEARGRGLGVVFTDLDGDGLPDLYVANDLTLNFLFRGRGTSSDGGVSFEDLSLFSGTAVNREGKPEAGMGLAVGDVDGDLDPDLAVTNFDVETNTLYRNLGELAFDDVSAPSGFGPPSFNLLGFGLIFADLDRDGDLDAYVANGHIFERPPRENVAYRQPGQVLLGDGAGGFHAVECSGLAERATLARGLAAADVDNDGDVDLAYQVNGGEPELLRNDTEGGNWVGVELRGVGANTEAIGARVVLETDRGRRVRWVLAGESYQSSGDKRLLFGLAEGEEPRELEVLWPSDRRLRLSSPPAGHYLRLR